MRHELRLGLLFFAIVTIVGRFIESPIACFVVGLCTALGLCFSIIGWLPEKAYDGLLYRRLIRIRNERS